MEVLPIITSHYGSSNTNGECFRKLHHADSVLDVPFAFSSADWECAYYPASEEDGCNAAASALAKRLEEELRAAKRSNLSCGEVLLPCGLLQKISEDVLELADSELCGLRGCTLYIGFEGEGEEDSRKLGTVKLDPFTASTFELYLTLKQSAPGWNAFLPQFLK